MIRYIQTMRQRSIRLKEPITTEPQALACASVRRYNDVRHFILLYSFSVSLLVSSGCQTTSSPQSFTNPSGSYEVTKDVDRTRALTPLHQVKPAVKTPGRSKTVKPLSEKAARRIETAQQLVAQQRYTEAALELERALRYDPNHPDIHRTLAILHWQAGNVERARTHARRALESHQDVVAAHYILGREKTLAGNDRDAITAYRTALRCSDLDQDSNTEALCHYHLAQVLGTEGYLLASLEQYQAFENTVARLEPANRSRELQTLIRVSKKSIGEAKSRMFEKLGRFAEAASALEMIIRSSPPNTARSIRYARLLLRAGNADDALHAARAIDSDDEEVIALLFDIYERAGHPERMLVDLRDRISHHPHEPRFVLSLADMLIRLDRLDEVRNELQHFLDQSPKARRVRKRLVDVLIKQRAWQEVLRVCSEGYQNDGGNTVGFEDKIASIAQYPSAVATILDQRDEQDHHIIIYLRGILAESAGRSEQAQALFHQCYEKAPSFVPVRYALGNAYLKSHRYEDALRVANRKDANHPEDARLELLLGKVYDVFRLHGTGV